MKSIVHFEIPFDDKERAIKFYSELFDWKIDEMPEIGYIGATTSPTGDDMILKEPGAINGALVPRTNDQPNIVVTINVDSNNFYQPELAVRGILGTDILEANLNFKHVPFLKLYVCEHIVPRMEHSNNLLRASQSNIPTLSDPGASTKLRYYRMMKLRFAFQ